MLSCSSDITPVGTPIDVISIPAETKDSQDVKRLSIVQPEWIKDPNANILLFSWGAIVSPENQDMVFLDMGQPHWVDNNHIEFYSKSEIDSFQSSRKKYILDLIEWQIVEAATEDGKVVNSDSEDHPNLWIQRGEENTPIKIYNEKSEQWEIFLYPPQGLYNLNAAYIAGKIFVLQGQAEFGPGIIIRVYDFNTKHPLKTYAGNIDQNIIRVSDSKLFYVTEHRLCFIEVESLEETCGARIPENLNNVVLSWNIDFPEAIPFTYEEPFEKYFSTRKLCLVDFYEGEVRCPLEGLEIFEPKISKVKNPNFPNGEQKIAETIQVWGYVVSPDHQQVVFCYGNSAYVRYEGIAIIDMDGSNFYLLDDIDPFFNYLFTNECRYNLSLIDVEWRPLQ